MSPGDVVLAVQALACAVVDDAAPGGPHGVPPCPVAVVTWAQDPDLYGRAQARPEA